MTAYQFFKLGSVWVKIRVIHSVFDIPAFIVHELSHYLFAKILFVKVTDVKLHYFYEVDGNNLNTYGFSVYTQHPNTTMGNLRGILVNMPPLITAFILCTLHPYFVFWVLFSMQQFLPSSQDFANAKGSINRLLAN